MFSCNRRRRTSPHPWTGELHDWAVVVDGREVAWQSYAGPVRLDETDIDIACRKLLSIEPCDLLDMVLEHVEFSSASDGQSRLIVHSTTPSAREFETDLTAMVEGRPVSDLTTYVETRGLYLARSGDLVVGRTRPWRRAIAKEGVWRLTLPDTDHYYMSHALLRRAVDAGEHDPVLAQIIEFLRERPSTVVSPYDFEPEFQILLTWLALVSGLGRIRVDANNSRLGAWNGKRMLHPTVESALRLNGQVSEQAAPLILKQEHRASEAFQAEFMARYPAGGRGLQTAFSSRALRRVRRRSARYCRILNGTTACEEIAVVPGRWAMIATSGQTSVCAGAQALTLERMLAVGAGM